MYGQNINEYEKGSSAPPMMPISDPQNISPQIPQIQNTFQTNGNSILMTNSGNMEMNTQMMIQQMNFRIMNLEGAVSFLQKKVTTQEVEIKRLQGLVGPDAQKKKEQRGPQIKPKETPIMKKKKVKTPRMSKVCIYDYQGNCLDISGQGDDEEVICWEVRNGERSQQFWCQEPGQWCFIESVVNRSRVLDDSSSVDKKNHVVRRINHGGDCQMWRFNPVGDDYFAIEGKLSKKFLRSNGIGNEVTLDDIFDNLQNRFRLVGAK